MKLMVVTDNLRGCGIWPVRLRSEGYEVVCQNIRQGSVVLSPHAAYPVILMHFTGIPDAQALAAVRMFHRCYANSSIVVLARPTAEYRAFEKSGAQIHLSEPVDASLVFDIVAMLWPRPLGTGTPAGKEALCATHSGPDKSLAPRAE